MNTPEKEADFLIKEFLQITPVEYDIDMTPEEVNKVASRDLFLCKKCAIIAVKKLIKEHTFNFPIRWNVERKKHWEKVLEILNTK